MAILTVERDITKPVSDREDEEATLLLAAMIDGDSGEVHRMLTDNAIIRSLLERGALRLFGDVWI